MPILPEVTDGIRAGVVPFATNGQGASYGFEYLNTGANAIHMISNTVGNAAAGGNEFANAISAQQYIGTATAADGAAFVVNSDMGFINVTKYNQTGLAAAQSASWVLPICAQPTCLTCPVGIRLSVSKVGTVHL